MVPASGVRVSEVLSLHTGSQLRLDTFYSGGYSGLDKMYPNHVTRALIEPVSVLTEKPTGQGHQEISRHFAESGTLLVPPTSQRDVKDSRRASAMGRPRLFIFITAIILLPVLLGMTPLNFVQKIGSGCPLSHVKQVRSAFCPFNSIVSHDDTASVAVDSVPLGQFSLDHFAFQLSEPVSQHRHIRLSSLPLRC